MSYILDALRKAEAERERGNVPGVHAQPLFPPSAPHARAGRRPPVWMVPASAAVLLLAAAGVWFGVERSGPSSQPGPASDAAQAKALATAVAPPPATVVTLPATSTAGLPPTGPSSIDPRLSAAPPAPAPAPAPAVPTRSLDSIVAALPKAASAPSPSVAPANDRNAPQSALAAPVATPMAAPSPPSATATSSNAVGMPAVPPTNAPSAVPSPTEARIYALNELPDEIRRQLPLLSVGGSMYSPNSANRLLIVNGQVLHEGDRVTPELVLQQIKVKAAVLVFKGYRYTINY